MKFYQTSMPRDLADKLDEIQALLPRTERLALIGLMSRDSLRLFFPPRLSDREVSKILNSLAAPENFTED